VENSAVGKAPLERRNDVTPLHYVARQPIFDRDEKVIGYELLFRDGLENAFSGTDLEAASRATLDSSLLMGLDVLCDGRRAFLNCTRETLVHGLVQLLPPRSAVVEILETVSPDTEVMTACQRLKQAGYLIALDDYVMGDTRGPLVGLADIIKVEMKLTTPMERAQLLKRPNLQHCQMLAEKVETREEFAAAHQLGFRYFQGYFFRKPELLSARKMPASRLQYLRMLQEVSHAELDVPALEKLIKAEASICYRLLRYMNSAMFGFNCEIHSVRHALAILGDREVRRWVRLVAAVGAGQGRASDLVLSSLVRARFSELLSPQVDHGESDLFLLGLLSLIDSMLEMSMTEILEKVPLDHETKAVLLGKPSRLRPVYQLMLAYESGEWDAAKHLADTLHLEDQQVAAFYWQAQQWARDVLSGV
jgi:c-di-GMP-related signal transduction protein